MTLPPRLWLCFPLGVAALLDGTLTLCGQPADYWNGDYGSVREFNPVGWLLLRWHPLAFVLASLVNLVLVVVAVSALSRRWAVPLMFLVFFGHTLGAASWMANRGWWGWGLALAWLVLAERLLSLVWPKAEVSKGETA